ncbi:DUF5798 family protein [Halorubrum vacuolatum]|uniref:Uncharacterized protein n=1 Tax=Halorubrum vacuolatum TaxID=63740 RepID=A0A238XUX4_HALVU|nr:DUF5798 family protein [Halorubrum vacuolatum]SNR62532.1 hypothetical protein SAMN06264855_12335 [Halorubrum vacuolatum]
MGFGDTAKRIQTLADKAEQTYQKLNELRDEVQHTQTTVTDTAERVGRLENELAEQRAILNAIAEEVGVDLEATSAEAHISEAEHIEAEHVEAEHIEAASDDDTADATADGADEAETS